MPEITVSDIVTYFGAEWRVTGTEGKYLALERQDEHDQTATGWAQADRVQLVGQQGGSRACPTHDCKGELVLTEDRDGRSWFCPRCRSLFKLSEVEVVGQQLPLALEGEG